MTTCFANTLRWRAPPAPTVPPVACCYPDCWRSGPRWAAWSQYWVGSETGSAPAVGSLSGCGWCCRTAAVSMEIGLFFQGPEFQPSIPLPAPLKSYFLLSSSKDLNAWWPLKSFQVKVLNWFPWGISDCFKGGLGDLGIAFPSCFHLHNNWNSYAHWYYLVFYFK